MADSLPCMSRNAGKALRDFQKTGARQTNWQTAIIKGRWLGIFPDNYERDSQLLPQENRTKIQIETKEISGCLILPSLVVVVVFFC